MRLQDDTQAVAEGPFLADAFYGVQELAAKLGYQTAKPVTEAIERDELVAFQATPGGPRRIWGAEANRWYVAGCNRARSERPIATPSPQPAPRPALRNRGRMPILK